MFKFLFSQCIDIGVVCFIELEQVVEQEAADEEHITTEDLEEIEDILESVAEERNKMKIEQEDLKELKQDVSEYMEVMCQIVNMKVLCHRIHWGHVSYSILR